MLNIGTGKKQTPKWKMSLQLRSRLFFLVFLRLLFNVLVKLLVFLTYFVGGFSFMFTNSAVCSCTSLHLFFLTIQLYKRQLKLAWFIQPSDMYGWM